MIKDPPVLRIRRSFPRPPADVVAALAGAATGHLVDSMGGGGALDWRIKPLAAAPSGICGVALTCDAGPGDNLALFAALDVAKPGDVVMVAAQGHLGSAILGDLLAGMARNCGIGAIVIDGAVRDVSGILATGLPVYCAGVTPNSGARSGPGTVGLPIVMGGVAIASGDIIVGDADGVVVVPRAIAANVVNTLAEVRKTEAALEARVKAGLRLPDSVISVLASGRVEEIP